MLPTNRCWEVDLLNTRHVYMYIYMFTNTVQNLRKPDVTKQHLASLNISHGYLKLHSPMKVSSCRNPKHPPRFYSTYTNLDTGAHLLSMSLHRRAQEANIIEPVTAEANGVRILT